MKELFYSCDPCGMTDPPSCLDGCGFTWMFYLLITVVGAVVVSIIINKVGERMGKQLHIQNETKINSNIKKS